MLILPLDGGVSAMSNAAHQVQLVPLSNSETVGDQNFFVNEYVVAEKNPVTSVYYSAASSVGGTQVAETIEAVEASTPYRKISPERVLAIKVARHRPDYPSPPPAINFDGPIYLPSGPSRERVLTRDESLVERPADRGRTTWRFAVELDVRDALGLERQAKVLWSEHPVLPGWLDSLQDSMSIQSDDQHRVLVYAVVEVDRDELRVQQFVPLRPQCCCGGLICV